MGACPAVPAGHRRAALRLRGRRAGGCELAGLRVRHDKDYLKAVKEQGRFFKVPVEEAAEFASELVHARGAKFERGVVFKQWVQLALHGG